MPNGARHHDIIGNILGIGSVVLGAAAGLYLAIASLNFCYKKITPPNITLNLQNGVCKIKEENNLFPYPDRIKIRYDGKKYVLTKDGDLVKYVGPVDGNGNARISTGGTDLSELLLNEKQKEAKNLLEIIRQELSPNYKKNNQNNK